MVPAGQAVVWYTGQFYALFFLTQTLKVDPVSANLWIAASLALGTPFFVFFGWLSDKIGRKPIIMAGCLLAVLTYFPLFNALTTYANPKLAAAIQKSPVKVEAPAGDCNLILNLTGTAKFTSACDLARTFLANSGVNYDKVDGPAGTIATVKIGDKAVLGYEAAYLGKAQLKRSQTSRRGAIAILGAGLTGLWTAWYLARHDPGLRIVIVEREIAGFGASVMKSIESTSLPRLIT